MQLTNCFVSFVVVASLFVAFARGATEVKYLSAGDEHRFHPAERKFGFLESRLMIYCFSGANKSLSRLFHSVEFNLDIANDDYVQYEGGNAKDVVSHYDQHNSIFSINFFSNRRKNKIQLSPFNQTCVGIDSTQPYRVQLNLIRLDFRKVILLLIGLFVFAFSAELSKNSFLFYATGVLLGIFASFMVLIYFVGKLLPTRALMYGTVISGWTIGIYFLQLIFENLQFIFIQYRTYVLWYACITGIISFVICYKIGPPRDKKNRNLIKWGLQLVALLMVFLSSHFEEAMVALILLITIFYYFPRHWISRALNFYRRRFPPKRRLLSLEEFHDEGVRETAKALAELREFCSSPDCKQWKMMTKLKDPLRFAAFVEGSSHLLDEEVLHYDSKEYSEEISEDESGDDEMDSSWVHSGGDVSSPVGRNGQVARRRIN